MWRLIWRPLQHSTLNWQYSAFHGTSYNSTPQWCDTFYCTFHSAFYNSMPLWYGTSFDTFYDTFHGRIPLWCSILHSIFYGALYDNTFLQYSALYSTLWNTHRIPFSEPNKDSGSTRDFLYSSESPMENGASRGPFSVISHWKWL